MLLGSSHQQPQFIIEITILSAEGLKNTSSALFSHRLRPFVTISTVLPAPSDRDNNRHSYQTRVDDSGGVNPTWGDKFRVPVDSTFFANRYSCIYLQLYTKRLISGKTLLGWCHIPVSDIGVPPAGSLQHRSYRLRARDGSRGPGTLNVSVKLESATLLGGNGFPLDTCQTVIGVPLTVWPHVGKTAEN
ncbi:hypothetical protein SLEP1_g32855 [Rubroshorea leprosula]|uniref:C2 domain-containing protein n=1 Tax=Rubroshorea leprosula TaxID=152421 RepID=A0AAV5KER3_9ROSI|nr:hypothetical protein SLEP1_g32855 [Rubroshorea leprosula]